MTDFLSRCDHLIATNTQTYVCNATPQQTINQVNCFSCVRDSFRSAGRDTYNCLIKLCHYSINYGPIYTSEIYHFLEESHFLEVYFLNLTRPINVLSLGSGFGPDYIALNKYRNDKQLHMNFNYLGWDKEPLWNQITNTNVPATHDILNGFQCPNADIIFINKLFSTLKNHNLDTQFLSVFAQSLQTLPIGSFVVFNDVNSMYMGRDNFDTFAQQNSLQAIGKYFFDVQGTNGNSAYNGGYTAIQSTHNIFQTPANFQHTPKPYANQTVFFLYRKV